MVCGSNRRINLLSVRAKVGVPLPGIVAGGVIFAGIVVWAYVSTGSMRLVGPFLNGQRLLIERPVLSLGSRKAGETVDCELALLNCTGKTVRILGAQTDCGCMTIDKFPMAVAAGERRQLSFGIRLPQQSGAFRKRVVFFSDCPDQSRLLVEVEANVAGEAQNITGQ